MSNTKPVVLTGLRVNNDLHIGNYLGALLPMIDFARNKADEHQINLFIPDLHSITTPVGYDQLQQSVQTAVQTYLALGLPIEHDNVKVYRQSRIPAHSELAWILSCFTSFGEMSRMTQFKDKSRFEPVAEYDSGSKSSEEIRLDLLDHQESRARNVSVGLFNYPILMAADILLYGATHVPVGDDQTQHLEFTRDIAERLNNKFNQELFVVPKSVKEQHEFFGKDQGLRIRDLVDPSKKMSKSSESDKGTIFLTDSPDVAHKKILSATTDSLGEVDYDFGSRPGISNLLDILELFGGSKSDFIGQNQYGPLKQATSDAVCEFLSAFQEKLQATKDTDIEQLLVDHETKAAAVANATLERVQVAIGLK